MRGMKRRSFLKGTLAAGAASLLAPYSYSRVLGANDAIRLGIIGFRGQGGSHLGTHLSKEFQDMGVRVVALCDVDKGVLERGVKKCEEAGNKVEAVQDMRKIFDMKDVDAVVCATPNHWHSLCTIWACQAGKDVYVEKPLSHDIFEGRRVVEAAAKYKRVVFVGTQNRSDEALAEAIDWLQKGNLGKIVRARGFCYKQRGSIGKTEGPQKVPENVDYDLFCGPAPNVPLRRRGLHYDWHWFWATGNADIGNQGIHEMDKCRWGVGATIVKRAMGIGGRFGYDDDAETPNTETVFLETDTCPIIFEVRGLPKHKATDQDKNPPMDAYAKGDIRIGEVIECEGGYFAGGWIYDNEGKKVRQVKRDGGGKHRANFIKLLRSRKDEDNPSKAIDGHRSAMCFHAGNLSYRVGKQMKREELTERFKADKVAQECWERFQQHVSANEAEPEKWQPAVGPWLTFDPEKERFTGEFADKANALVKGPADGKYREPFVVPDQV
ncbi:MAG: Gfo/Idh/MocA family oxidoreductase [Planctomycetes bacterium]|nr:Gfo/Idh/MocA family oxidoreductase [Planctomycetota bacterium]